MQTVKNYVKKHQKLCADDRTTSTATLNQLLTLSRKHVGKNTLKTKGNLHAVKKSNVVCEIKCDGRNKHYLVQTVENTRTIHLKLRLTCMYLFLFKAKAVGCNIASKRNTLSTTNGVSFSIPHAERGEKTFPGTDGDSSEK
ncbi:hypothetical protein T265_15744, partial [Opisthorchis viverrini]